MTASKKRGRGRRERREDLRKKKRKKDRRLDEISLLPLLFLSVYFKLGKKQKKRRRKEVKTPEKGEKSASHRLSLLTYSF